MRDLRKVNCLTPNNCEGLRESFDCDEDERAKYLIEALDTLDVAVAALRKAWRLFAARYCHMKYGPLKSMFCDMHNLTLTQAEALGIFEEGT